MARKALYKHATQVDTNTYPDDGSSPVGSNEWNADPDQAGMLGVTPTTATITIASGVATVTDSITVVAAESGTSDVLDKLAITNTNQYDLIYLFADTGDTITLTNTSSPSADGHIQTISGANETLSTTKPTILIRKGNYWYGYGGGTASGLDTTNFAASAIITASETIGSNDNDTTLPTSAAVKDYVDASAGNLDTTDFAAATLVTESEGIGSNDNDTTMPTSAAVKDYVDASSGMTKIQKTYSDIVSGAITVYALPAANAINNAYIDVTTAFVGGGSAASLGIGTDNSNILTSADLTALGLTDSTRGTAITTFKGMLDPDSATDIKIYGVLGNGTWASGGTYPWSTYTTSGSNGSGSGDALSSGGNGNNGTYSSTSAKYNGTSWSATNSMGTGRNNAGSIGSSQNTTMAIGGNSNYATVNSTESFDGTSWSAEGNLTQVTKGGEGGGTKTSACIFGGSNYAGTKYTTIEKYNGTSWSNSSATLTTATADGYGGGSSSSSAIFTMGRQSSATTNETFTFDGTTLTTKNNNIRSDDDGVGGGDTNNMLAISGQDNGYTKTTTVEKFNGTSWSADSNISTARTLFSGGYNGTTAWVTAGIASSRLTSTEVYSLTAITAGALDIWLETV